MTQKKQLGLRVEVALLENLKKESSKERLSINEYIVRKLEMIVDNSIELKRKKELPEISAVYFVTNETGQIIYIGQSKNLKERWRSHNKFSELNTLGLVNINWFACEEDLLSEVEKLLIEVLGPVLNKKHIATESTDTSAAHRLRTKQFKIWLSQIEHEILIKEAKRCNLNPAELIRTWIHRTESAKQLYDLED